MWDLTKHDLYNLCSPVLREDKLGIVSKWFFYPQLKNYDDNILMKNVLPVKGRYVCSLILLVKKT